MADRRSQVLNFIYWTIARKKKSERIKFFIGPEERLNGEEVARAMGIDPAQISRVLHNRQDPGPKFMEGLKRLAGFTLDSDLYAAIEETEPAPPGAYGDKYP